MAAAKGIAAVQSHWFEVALVFGGIILGTFAQGMSDTARHASMDNRLTALAETDSTNYQALQASFRRRDDKSAESLAYVTVAVNEILQRLARMEGSRK